MDGCKNLESREKERIGWDSVVDDDQDSLGVQ